MPDPLSGIPSQFEAGDTVIFTEDFADYSPSAYRNTCFQQQRCRSDHDHRHNERHELSLYALGGSDGGNHAGNLHRGVLHDERQHPLHGQERRGEHPPKPHRDGHAELCTGAGHAAQNRARRVQRDHAAERQLQRAILSRASIKEYQHQLTYYRAEVIRETAAANAARGVTTGNRIAIQFIPANDNNPVTVAQ